MYVKGRRARKINCKRSQHMKHLNFMKKCTDDTEISDHTYYDHGNCSTTDLENMCTVGADVEVRQTPWFEGRRVVEFRCFVCGHVLCKMQFMAAIE